MKIALRLQLKFTIYKPINISKKFQLQMKNKVVIAARLAFWPMEPLDD